MLATYSLDRDALSSLNFTLNEMRYSEDGRYHQEFILSHHMTYEASIAELLERYLSTISQVVHLRVCYAMYLIRE